MFNNKMKELFGSFYREVRNYLKNYLRKDEVTDMTEEDMKNLLAATDAEIEAEEAVTE